MKKWFIFIMCLWAFPASAQGTYTATSCSLSAVSAAIAAEQARPVDGDIISIPAGSCSWSSGLTQTFNNSVTIQGAGAISATTGGASTTGSDLTTLTSSIGPPLMSITTVAGKSFRFTGIAIANTAPSNTLLTIEGTSTAVRVDHCHFHNITNVGLWVGGSINGVADHILFDAAQGTLNNPMAYHNGIGWNGSTEGGLSNAKGDHSWADTEHWGSSRFFFVEDSQFNQGDLGDGSDAARYVFRYNTVLGTNGQEYNHGTTGSRGRGIRAAEVYHNNYNRSNNASTQPSFSLNSGTLLFWGNTSTNVRHMAEIDYTRKDNGTYNYGAPPSGWGNCNGAGTFTGWDGPAPGYPCMDQVARGAGDLLVNDFPTVCDSTTFPGACSVFTGSFVHQQLSPLYIWANNYNDAGYSPEGIFLANVPALYQDNRDYYQQFGTYGEPGSFNGTKGVGQGLLSARPSTCTAGPGGNTPGVGYWATDTNTLYVCNPTNTWSVYYTPYTYPHPLAAGGSTSVNPPTNLAATVQ